VFGIIGVHAFLTNHGLFHFFWATIAMTSFHTFEGLCYLY